MRYLPSGDPLTNFSVATDYRYTNRDGEQVDQTEWFRISCSKRLAEIANQSLQRGSRVYLEGSLQSRKWTAQDGTEHSSNAIWADKLVFLDSPSRGSSGGDANRAGGDAPVIDHDTDAPPW